MHAACQPARKNLDAFQRWVVGKADDNYRQMAHRGSLNRVEIATECGFDKSALQRNPAIRVALRTCEDELRARGPISPRVQVAESAAQQRSGGVRAACNDGRLRTVEQENAALRAELRTLRAALQRFEGLDEVLADTGRLPK